MKVTVELDDERRRFEPGEKISGRVKVQSDDGPIPGELEVCLVWETRGKGSRDTATGSLALPLQAGSPRDSAGSRFELTAPPGPWSYTGRLLSIRWLVRARLNTEHGDLVFGEESFELVSPAKPRDRRHESGGGS